MVPSVTLAQLFPDWNQLSTFVLHVLVGTQQGINTSSVQNLLNKDSCQTKFVFLFPILVD
jgi:hypothetical protein